MTDGFLHLHDAEDATPVRIRISRVDLMYIHTEKESMYAFHGGAVATKEQEPFTMLVLNGGTMHGVQETIPDIEGQMADFYELAGMEAAQ